MDLTAVNASLAERSMRAGLRFFSMARSLKESKCGDIRLSSTLTCDPRGRFQFEITHPFFIPSAASGVDLRLCGVDGDEPWL
jgi:hypothetical protein